MKVRLNFVVLTVCSDFALGHEIFFSHQVPSLTSESTQQAQDHGATSWLRVVTIHDL
jgi:hypothetical protein